MKNTLNIIILTLIVISSFTGCKEGNNQSKNKEQVVTDTTEITIVYDDTLANPIIPGDSLSEVNILTTGVFHKDEVPQDADKRKWFGLFKRDNGFYLEQTQIKTRRVHDPVLDESNKKTGWEVTTVNKDSNWILIEAIPILQNKVVKHVPLSKKYIYPGDTIRFSYLGTNYMLYATGWKKQIPGDTNFYIVRNYKLFIKAIKGQYNTTQLLVAQPSFDDRMIEILFAGDIDGDEMLDLIIDTASHYNVTSPTVYLSKPATKKQLLKPVGRHTSKGA